MGASRTDQTLKKIVVFSYSTQQQWTISWLDCDVQQKVDFMWQSVMTSSGTALKRSFKVQICTKKVMVNVWWSAACLIHYSFLNPCETITSEKHAQQINGMHWKLQHLQLVLVNRKRPILHENTQPDIAQPTHHMLNELGYEVLPHLPYSPDLLPTDDHFFKHLDNFCRENASTTSQIQKTPSMSLSNPGAWIFTEQE